MKEITENAFLNGRLRIQQPAKGYRAGADPVFLAAAVPAVSGQRVLDVGCGVGTVSLCLMSRVPDLRATLLEVQPDLVELARSNLVRNGFSGDVLCAELCSLPNALREISFDHVVTNPPFFDRTSGSRAHEAGREKGRGGSLSLADWLAQCLKRVRSGGYLTLINRIENLPECLSSLRNQAGEVVVQPLAPRAARPAKLFVLRAKKGAKGLFKLASPLVLHRGDCHVDDGDSYTEEAHAILRSGNALPLEV